MASSSNQQTLAWTAQEWNDWTLNDFFAPMIGPLEAQMVQQINDIQVNSPHDERLPYAIFLMNKGMEKKQTVLSLLPDSDQEFSIWKPLVHDLHDFLCQLKLVLTNGFFDLNDLVDDIGFVDAQFDSEGDVVMRVTHRITLENMTQQVWKQC